MHIVGGAPPPQRSRQMTPGDSYLVSPEIAICSVVLLLECDGRRQHLLLSEELGELPHGGLRDNPFGSTWDPWCVLPPVPKQRWDGFHRPIPKKLLLRLL